VPVEVVVGKAHSHLLSILDVGRQPKLWMQPTVAMWNIVHTVRLSLVAPLERPALRRDAPPPRGRERVAESRAGGDPPGRDREMKPTVNGVYDKDPRTEEPDEVKGLP